MRLAPVAIRHWSDRVILRDVAARQSRTTHARAEAANAIEGRPRSQVLRPRDYPWAGRIGEIMAGSWRGKRRNQIGSSGYVAERLEAALWCVGRSDAFKEAVPPRTELPGPC